jgi:hypothetical protein
MRIFLINKYIEINNKLIINLIIISFNTNRKISIY